jgi:hypothetical protein
MPFTFYLYPLTCFLIIETAIKGKATYLAARDDDVKFDREVSEFLSNYGISVTSAAKFLNLIEK